MEELSFVIQGNVLPQALVNLPAVKSVKYFFPNSPIVVSTWGAEEEIIQLEDKFIVIINKKMEGRKYTGDAWAANFYRQARTVISGLKLVETEYACKMRSDCFFENNLLKDNYNKFLKTNKEFLHIEKLIRFPYFNFGCDWFQIGQTSKLKEIWGKLDTTELDLQYYNHFKKHGYDNLPNFYARYHSEQLVYMSQFGISYEGRHVIPSFSEYLQQRFHYKNTIFLTGKKDIGLNSVKYPNKKLDIFPAFINLDIIYFFKIFFEVLIGRMLCFFS